MVHIINPQDGTTTAILTMECMPSFTINNNNNFKINNYKLQDNMNIIIIIIYIIYM